MSAINAEMEMELEDEWEGEAEDELESPGALPAPEGEAEAEMEQEAFFNHLASMADRGGRSQALRRIGLAAARQALRSYRKVPPAILGESEAEDEAFFELEAETNPLRAQQCNAMMEHLSHEAASAESEEEAAEQFLPLIPLAAKAVLPLAAKLGARVLPKLARKVAPHLTRGVSQVARTLFRSKATRPLLRVVPRIAKKTMVSLARQAAHGHHVTPRAALRTLARQTARTLGHPRSAAHAFHRSKLLDRRYHLGARRLLGAPAGRLPARRSLIARRLNYRWPARYGARHFRPGVGGAWAHRRYAGKIPRYYSVGAARAGFTKARPGYYRHGVGAAGAPHAFGAPKAGRVAPAAQCLCFQPVSCASCAGVCPNCHR